MLHRWCLIACLLVETIYLVTARGSCCSTLARLFYRKPCKQISCMGAGSNWAIGFTQSNVPQMNGRSEVTPTECHVNGLERCADVWWIVHVMTRLNGRMVCFILSKKWLRNPRWWTGDIQCIFSWLEGKISTKESWAKADCTSNYLFKCTYMHPYLAASAWTLTGVMPK